MSDWTSALDPSSGSTYYYNAVTGETRWDPPEGFAEAAAGAAAAEGGAAATATTGGAADWTTAVDPSSGETYYYNATTGETSWEKPQALRDADSATAAASTAQASGTTSSPTRSSAADGAAAKLSAKDRLEQRRLSVLRKRKEATGKTSKKSSVSLAEKLKARSARFAKKRGKAASRPRPPPRPKAADGATETAAAPAEADSAPLPAGWEACTDPDSGAVYYYKAETGESSWDRPTA